MRTNLMLKFVMKFKIISTLRYQCPNYSDTEMPRYQNSDSSYPISDTETHSISEQILSELARMPRPQYIKVEYLI